MADIKKPRSLKTADDIAARRALLGRPHIARLTDYTASLRGEDRGTVPEFDPLDGGVSARLLFLMEKPGPMTDDLAIAGKVGSGFVSRDNNDPTAEAIFGFMREAEIAREETLLWNVIPWWNGSRAIRKAEWIAGLDRLETLLDLLKGLEVVIAVGRRAARAENLVRQRGLAFRCSAHPSPINRAARPKIWKAIPQIWAQAAAAERT